MRTHLLAILVALIVIQTSCVFVSEADVEKTTEVNETFVGGEIIYYRDDEEYRKYVDKVNDDLHFLFNYTRALNKQAKARGVVPSVIKPICEFVEWGKLRDPPVFRFSKNIESLEDMNSELADYIRVNRELYKLQAEDFKRLEQVARELCTY